MSEICIEMIIFKNVLAQSLYILDTAKRARRSFAGWFADVWHLDGAVRMREGAAVVFSSGVQEKASFS
jgi:hypothetical protein